MDVRRDGEGVSGPSVRISLRGWRDKIGDLGAAFTECVVAHSGTLRFLRYQHQLASRSPAPQIAMRLGGITKRIDLSDVQTKLATPLRCASCITRYRELAPIVFAGWFGRRYDHGTLVVLRQ